ncbi:MAG: hypothetical protein NZ561_10525 [Phycisphaerae bacterium]|nr:hypothetical protein [Phycisphaerae bacterium]
MSLPGTIEKPTLAQPGDAARRLQRGMVLLAICGIVTYVVQAPARHEIDSHFIEQGLREFFAWFRGGMTGPIAQPSAYPIFQYLTGLLAPALGTIGIPLTMNEIWSLSSRLSYLALPYLTYRTVRARGGSFPTAGFAALVMLAGPLAAYATSTFNELPAALLTAGFAASLLCGRSLLLIALLSVLAGITKEFAPFLLALLWLALIGLDPARRPTRVHLAALSLSLVLAVAINAGFNQFRFGTPRNVEYLDDPRLVQSVRYWLGYALALWLAPNGGVVASWPLWAGLFLAVLPLRSFPKMLQSPPTPCRAAACASAAALLVALILTAGLAAWLAPFGWYCWGPRLLLPWLPTILLILIAANPATADLAVQGALRTRARRWALAILILASTLPAALLLYDEEVLHEFFNQANAQRAHLRDPHDLQSIHRVALDIAWRHWPPMLLLPLRHIAIDPSSAVIPLVLCASLQILLGSVRCDCPGVINPSELSDLSRKPGPRDG